MGYKPADRVQNVQMFLSSAISRQNISCKSYMCYYANLYITVHAERTMAKKVILTEVLCIALILLSLSFVSAALSVEKRDRGSVIIAELDNPAVFNFLITNDAPTENAELYSLLDITLTPRGVFEIPDGASSLDVQVFLPKSVRRNVRGPYVFEYQIKGDRSGIFKDALTLSIVPLKDALTIEPASFKPNSQAVNITVKNQQNTHFNNFSLLLSSDFFTSRHSLSLKPYENATLSVPLDKAKITKRTAGSYLVTASLQLEDARTEIEGTLMYLEQRNIAANTTITGALIRQTTVTRTNTGNVPVADTITFSRDILTRLFTTHSITPLTANRNALAVKYEWQRELKPGESWSVTSTTNYTFPFILLVLLIALVVLIYRTTSTTVVVHKRVSPVKTRGGQFALKVQLSIRARRTLSNVRLTDTVPAMTKLYERFGTKPDKIDAATRRISWHIPHLHRGEERVVSYIIYSNVVVLGRVELAPATVTYEHNNAVHQAFSNRAFFISETAPVERSA